MILAKIISISLRVKSLFNIVIELYSSSLILIIFSSTNSNINIHNAFLYFLSIVLYACNLFKLNVLIILVSSPINISITVLELILKLEYFFLGVRTISKILLIKSFVDFHSYQYI